MPTSLQTKSLVVTKYFLGSLSINTDYRDILWATLTSFFLSFFFFFFDAFIFLFYFF